MVFGEGSEQSQQCSWEICYMSRWIGPIQFYVLPIKVQKVPAIELFYNPKYGVGFGVVLFLAFVKPD